MTWPIAMPKLVMPAMINRNTKPVPSPRRTPRRSSELTAGSRAKDRKIEINRMTSSELRRRASHQTTTKPTTAVISRKMAPFTQFGDEPRVANHPWVVRLLGLSGPTSSNDGSGLRGLATAAGAAATLACVAATRTDHDRSAVHTQRSVT